MRASFSIRTKLLLVALLLLLIPWMSYLYVRDMKAFLLSGQESALALTARAVATVLHDRPELFIDEDEAEDEVDDAESDGQQSAENETDNASTEVEPEEVGLEEATRTGNEILAVPLPNYINLDGDPSDWGALVDRANDADEVARSSTSQLQVNHRFGYHGRFIYVLFEVQDDAVILRSPGFLRVDAADHIRVTLQDPGQVARRFTLIARQDGRMSIYLMDEDWRYPITGEPNYDLAAELKTTAQGYNVELRIPRFLLSSDTRVQMVVADVDDTDTLDVAALVPITPQADIEEATRVLVESPEIGKILSALNRPDTRIWVLDQTQGIQAVVGNISTDSVSFQRDRPVNQGDTFDYLLRTASYYYNTALEWVFTFIVEKPSSTRAQLDDSDDVRNDEIIRRALQGEVSNDRRPSIDQQGTILMSAHPVYLGDSILGAVIVEQSTNQLLQQQQSLLENVISVTLLTLLTVVAAILIFASRLTVRIRRLRNATDNAIDRDGRIINAKLSADAKSGDEIGDLSRSVSNMLGRLSQYTSYLRGLPDTLAHEVSNPLNVVNSSLHNLSQENPSIVGSKYLERATNGVNRIGLILQNLTEAANLEQAMQAETREVFDLVELIERYVDGYSISNPQQKFEVVIHSRPLMVEAAPDYIAQLLDKLVDNAVDFAAPDTAIVFKLQYLNEYAQIDVMNFGSHLPEGMQERIFEPLVSLGRKDAQKLRLGMGLYIVKLIASFHGGDVIARNLSGADGVIFSVSLPIYRAETTE